MPQFWSNISRNNRNLEKILIQWMHLITMHNSTKFYLNVIIISEVIHCTMCRNVFLRKTPINIFFAFFYYINLKSDTWTVHLWENLGFLELLNKFALIKAAFGYFILVWTKFSSNLTKYGNPNLWKIILKTTVKWT